MGAVSGTIRRLTRLITMKLSLLAGLAIVATPCVAQEAEAKPNMSAAFGNTIVSTYPDKRTGHLWLKADGTYTGTGRRKTPSSGVWTLKGKEFCLKQKKPIAVPFSYCTPAPNAGVGSTWAAKAITGERIQVTIVKGIVR